MTVIGVVDSGISNIRSVTNALAAIGVAHRQVLGPTDIADCSHLILPGDGTYHAGMERLNQSGLSKALQHAASQGKYILGICLGMQLLALEGAEYGACTGLGLIPGHVTRLSPADTAYPVPQIGWNRVQFAPHSRLAPCQDESAVYYFMHSYAYSDPRAPYVTATFEYGGEVVAMIEHQNIFGVQFHPEKSQQAGLKLLSNFTNLK